MTTQVRQAKLYYARVISEAIPKGRVAILRPNPVGAGQGMCINCSKQIRFDLPPSWETLEEVACSHECAKEAEMFRKPKVESKPLPPKESIAEVKTVSTDMDIPDKPSVQSIQVKEKRGNCAVCGGPPKGRGCTESTAAKLAAKNASKPSRGNCPECGGLPRGKGWAHKDGCKNSTAAKLAVVSSGSTGGKKRKKPKFLD